MQQHTPPLILSVNSDSHTLSFINNLLHHHGFAVKTANSSEEALDFLIKDRERPHLILIDLDMPVTGLNDYEFCARLQEHRDLSLIPMILLTSQQMQEHIHKVFALGAVECLTKPVEPEKLLLSVQKHVTTGQQWNQAFGSQRKAAPAEPPSQDLAPLMALPRQGSAPLNHMPVVAGAGHDLTGSPMRQLSVASDFTRFLNFLASQLNLSPEVWKRFANISEMDIYINCSALGIAPKEMARFIALYSEIKYISKIQPYTVHLGILPTPFCKKNLVVPLQLENGKFAFVISNPFNIELLDSIKRFKDYALFITEPEHISALFDKQGEPVPEEVPVEASMHEDTDISEIMQEVHHRYNPDDKIAFDDVAEGDELTESAKPAPIRALVARLIENGYLMGASDIHIEPQEEEVLVRYRIDGALKIVHRIHPPELINPIVSRIKVMSQLDISEHRLPQDGRIAYKKFNPRAHNFDLRVATAPMNFGEKVVMRIIDKQQTTLPLEAHGFSERHLKIYREKIRSPYGMILHVGPTGSGKSMTLYSALNEIKQPDINVQTAEDPIEYTLPGINQLQVHPDIGLTFAKALRSYLRQDPDVLLVGEIRDRETAMTAVEAALTGHLLLSTLHTNDAASSITRFLEMGVQPFMISSSIVLICAQRLLRRLCPQCKKVYAPSREEKQLVGVTPDADIMLYKPVGCDYCNDIGYKGRIGVHEILVPDDAIRLAINRPNITTVELKSMAIERGMTTLYWDSMTKVRQGLSSIEEVFSKIQPDDFEHTLGYVYDTAGVS